MLLTVYHETMANARGFCDFLKTLIWRSIFVLNIAGQLPVWHAALVAGMLRMACWPADGEHTKKPRYVRGMWHILLS